MFNLLRIQTGLREDQAPIEVESVGKTGPATIPLLLSMVGDKYKNANKLTKSLLCGFGVGLSWGAVGMDLSQTQFYAPLEI